MRLLRSAQLTLRLPSVWRAYRSRGQLKSDDEHLRRAAAWLLTAQRVPAGGYAHSYHLATGWSPPYPETSGYIIPSLRRLGERLGDARLTASVVAAYRWLCGIQQPNGSFLDLEGRAQVFDTGQILIGLNNLAEHLPALESRAPLGRAARWLVSVQETNGSFVAYAYNGRPHAYYARIGAALLAAGRVAHDERFREAGLRNLLWTLTRQQSNGFFQNLSFENEPPFLHTMMYVIEGLLDGYSEIRDKQFLAAALRFAAQLRHVSETRDGVLRSQYQPDYSVANREKCLTGLVQWAGVAFRIGRLVGGNGWREEGVKSLNFVKRQQIFSTDPGLDGGIFGSAPIHGRYMRFAIPNWGVKFFIDAILEKG